MQNRQVGDLKQALWQRGAELISGPALLSAGMLLARVLGLGFALVLAGALSPDDFGTVQYGITAGTLLAIGTQPFGQHVLARFVGRYRRDPARLRRTVSSGLLLLALVTALSMSVGLAALWRAGQVGLGAMSILLGLTIFYAYWGLASGFQSAARLTSVYLGSNLVQILLAALLIYGLQLRSPLPAMMIYGLSYLLPLTLLQWLRPLPIAFDLAQIERQSLAEITRFALPIWLSHASFTLYTTLDILLLQQFYGPAAVGMYSVAKTMAIVFGFVPASIATLLMPRIAGLDRRDHGSLLRKTLLVSLLVNGALLVIYLLLVRWFVGTVFGPSYVIDQLTYLLLAVGSIVLGLHSVITAVLVGSGRPGLETASRLVALAVTAAASAALIPRYATVGAAAAMLAGTLAALTVYLVQLLRRAAAPPTANDSR